LKLLLLGALLVGMMVAQTASLTLSAPSSTIAPGAIIQLPLTLAPAAGAQVLGTQWRATLPLGITAIGWTPVALTLTQASQALTCRPDNTICLIVGSLVAADGSMIPSSAFAGESARLTVQVSQALPPGSYPITLSETISTDAEGTLIPTTGVGVTLIIPAPASPYDLNQDGVVNGVDVGIASDQALGKTPCTNGDVNGDGKCNVRDVRQVIKAAR
jgi:hypothetical protein